MFFVRQATMIAMAPAISRVLPRLKSSCLSGNSISGTKIAVNTAGGTKRSPCATSSGGTQAGLVLGKQLFGLPFEIIGISVSEPAAQMVARVYRAARESAALIGADPVPESAITVLDSYIGAGYGKLDVRTAEAIRTVARLDGVLLDPVYTGKAMAGLIDLVRQHRWQAGQSVVFLHTGGIPALFAYWDALAGRPGNDQKQT